jgi:putative two-component system response regulator
MGVMASAVLESQLSGLVSDLGSRLSHIGRAELAEALEPLVEAVRTATSAEDTAAVAKTAFDLCRRLYANGRSAEGLPVARSLLEHADARGDRDLECRAAMVCGLLAGDKADIVAAVEYHARALRLADGDAEGSSRTWNNIGLAMAIAGNYELAGRCYQRGVAAVQSVPGANFSRYCACVNLANSHYQTGRYAEGLEVAFRALEEQTAEFREQDVHGALLLQRNIVRLLVALGRSAEAQSHVIKAVTLSERIRTPRAAIAAALTRSVYELAVGHSDVALTRLEKALTQARQFPGALRDTLASVAAAEEQAGNAERALMRLTELSDHIYTSAIERARSNIDLSLAGGIGSSLEHRNEQARARLTSQVAEPRRPDGWKAIERLAVSAVLRMDKTGWHGKRVGTLAKALALASGLDPLQSVEIGMATEVHDIGMLSIPEELLARKGPLSPVEERMVDRHVDAAAEILADDGHPRTLMAREIAKYHHARWDGEGYPERVGGKLIPLAARICAVADAYDAMVCGLGTHRRKTMDDALGELRRQAGRQFDPQLVACFDAMVRSETEDLGLNLKASHGMDDFQELVHALEEDRGFV